MEFERNDNTLQLCRDPVQRSQSASETSASLTCAPLPGNLLFGYTLEH